MTFLDFLGGETNQAGKIISHKIGLVLRRASFRPAPSSVMRVPGISIVAGRTNYIALMKIFLLVESVAPAAEEALSSNTNAGK